MKNIFKGLATALITPFDENGEIDLVFLKALLEEQINYVDYLVVLGTTAETPTLSLEEKNLILRTVVEKVKGRIPIVVGLSSNSTHNLLVELSELDLQGVSGLLSVLPYYNRPQQEGIYQHFANLAKSTELPIMLYNIPKRCGENIDAKTILRLANDFENILAVKEASGLVSQCADIISEKPENFAVISGDDSMTLPFISLGAEGLVSVVSNAYPDLVSLMLNSALANDYEAAQMAYYKLKDVIKLAFAEGNPAGIKCFLSQLWAKPELSQLRLPLTPVTQSLYEEIATSMNNE